MPISHQYRAIFVHIPKTAGTSVEAALGMHGEKRDVGIVPYRNQVPDSEHLYGRHLTHLSALAIKAALNGSGAFDAYFKFTIVRHPWVRLVSALAWREQKWAYGVTLTVAEFERLFWESYSHVLASRATPVAGTAYLLPQSSFSSVRGCGTIGPVGRDVLGFQLPTFAAPCRTASGTRSSRTK